MTDNNLLFDKQKEQLYSMLEYCNLNVPYYKGNINLPKDIKDFTYDYFSKNIPILDKKTIKENHDLLISDETSKDKLICESTTGSEGQPLLCYKSSKEKMIFGKRICKERADFVKDLRLFEKSAIFYGYQEVEGQIIHSEIFTRANTLYLSNFNLTPDKLKQYIEELFKFKPSWMMGPPSSIYSLANIVHKNKLEPYPFKYIELRGEYATKEQISFIGEVFNCPVANLYGTREFWDMAYAHNTEDMKLLDENIFVESVEYNKELGLNELLITTLVIKSWPLIRYKIGDFGDVYYKNDANGSNFYLDLVQGKKTEWMKFSNGVVLSPPMISSLSRATNKLAGYILIKGYQVIKINDNKLKIKLCCEDKNEILFSYLHNEITQIMGNEVLVEFEFVDYILPEKNIGKVKVFVDLTKE